MIRYRFIEQNVLKIYKQLPEIQFPVRLMEIISLIPNCRFMSYQELADLTKYSLSDIISICNGESGCTFYDSAQDRYLILCNQSKEYNSVRRQRWTCCHEIGHVICNHNPATIFSPIPENGSQLSQNEQFEREADFFTASLLAPLPFFKPLGVRSPADIMRIFGLSSESAKYRFAEFQEWDRSHRKTAWENDMLRQLKLKYDIRNDILLSIR